MTKDILLLIVSIVSFYLHDLFKIVIKVNANIAENQGMIDKFQERSRK